MTLIGIAKAAAKPVVWVAKYLAKALSITGLAMHGRPYQRADTASANPAQDPVPGPTAETPAVAPSGRLRDDLASVRSLTPDELLWQLELE